MAFRPRAPSKVLHLPVVVFACTADGLEETRQAFFHAGAEYVLVKPLKEQTLHKALEHFKHHHGKKKRWLKLSQRDKRVREPVF